MMESVETSIIAANCLLMVVWSALILFRHSDPRAPTDQQFVFLMWFKRGGIACLCYGGVAFFSVVFNGAITLDSSMNALVWITEGANILLFSDYLFSIRRSRKTW